MHITTTARHCEIDPEDKLFAQTHLEKLSRYASDLREAHLTISCENYRHTAEIAVKLRDHDFVGRETANSVRTAMIEAIAGVEHQIRKLKELRLERRRGGRTRLADAVGSPGEGPGEDGETLGGTE